MNFTSIKIRNTFLTLSVIMLLYFSFLVYLNVYTTSVSVALSVVVELFTIPLLLLLLASFVISIIQFVKKRFRTSYAIVGLLNIATMVMLIIAS